MKNQNLELSEDSIEIEKIKKAAAQSTREAFQSAINQNIPVLIKEGDELVLIKVSGERTFIKSLEPFSKV